MVLFFCLNMGLNSEIYATWGVYNVTKTNVAKRLRKVAFRAGSLDMRCILVEISGLQ